jgi:hypothetical protein
MIDPLPVGYVGLDEAVARLAADISDQEVHEEQKRLKRLDEAVARLAADISDQEVHKEQERQPTAVEEFSRAALDWAKRELAIRKLHVALRDGGLNGLVRDPVSGELFRLAGADWHAAAFWREIIVGGCICGQPGEEIGRHDGWRVLLEVAAFEAWLKARMQRRPQAADKDCGAWLEAAMRASPKRKPKRKSKWRQEAKEKFGVSGRAFDGIWDDKVKITGANWNHAGAPSKLPQ